MKAFVEYAVKGLVDHPELVEVVETEENGATLLRLRVHPDDIGKVIGRQGCTSAALRALLAVTAGKSGKRVHLDIVEHEGGRRLTELDAVPSGAEELSSENLES